jgi:hypothetical protein
MTMPSPRAAQIERRTFDRLGSFKCMLPSTVFYSIMNTLILRSHLQDRHETQACDLLKVTNINKDYSFSLKIMLQWIADLFCTSESPSKHPTMACDPVLQLVDHSVSYDTNIYLDKMISLAIVSPKYSTDLWSYP